MSVRRWIGVAGIVVAVAGGTAATAGGAGAEFEAQVAVRLHAAEPKGVPFTLLDEPERLVNTPDVRDLVRLRLGETPPLWVNAVTNDTILVRSRGATPQQAVEATTTYASSFVDVRRRSADAEVTKAAGHIQAKIDQLQRQLDSSPEPQRSSLAGVVGHFTTRLDELRADHASGRGPEVVGSGAAEPVDNGTRWAWVVAAFGAAVCIGAAVSARGAGSRPPQASS